MTVAALSLNSELQDLPQRTKTWDFKDDFAREADQRRRIAVPCSTLNSRNEMENDGIARARRFASWFSHFSRPLEDEERARGTSKKQLHESFAPEVSRLRVPIARSHISKNGVEELLALVVDENTSPRSTYQGDWTLHWMHIRHEQGIEFNAFMEMALPTLKFPLIVRTLVREWMLDIYTTQAQKVHGGKALDSCFHKQRITSRKGRSISCTFFAVPYLLLSEGCHYVVDRKSNTDFHPIRGLIQSAYRTDSLFIREQSQVVRKVVDPEEKALFYAPQLWCLIVGDHLITCSPGQLHTHPQSSIVPMNLDKCPAIIRLSNDSLSTFHVKAEECRTWFDFLLRVHHIYSCVMKKHIDVEQAVFQLADKGTTLDAQCWPALMKKTRGRGIYIDVKVILKERPNIRDKLNTLYSGKDKYFAQPWDSTWIKVPKRSFIVDILNTYNLPWKIDEDDSSKIYIQGLDDDFQQVLFEHARRLRNQRGGIAFRRLADDDTSDTGSESHYKPSNGSCQWPGCFHSSIKPRRRCVTIQLWAPDSYFLGDIASEDEEEDEAATPEEDKPRSSSHTSCKSSSSSSEKPVLPYLSSPIASQLPSLKRHMAANQVPESHYEFYRKAKSPLYIPSSLAKYIDGNMDCEDNTWRDLPRATKEQLDNLMSKTLNGTTAENYDALDHPDIELCSSMCQLIDHYLPENMECLFKDKIYGALHAILEDCQKDPYLKVDEIPMFADKVSTLLELSNNIRMGMRGGEDRVPLLQSHVDSLEQLCYAISSMYSYLRRIVFAREHTADPVVSASVSLISDLEPVIEPTNVDVDVDLKTCDNGPVSNDIDLDEKRKSVSPRASHFSTCADSEKWNKSGKGWRRWTLEEGSLTESNGLSDFNKVERCLKLCKLSTICLLGETKSFLSLDDYLAVRPSRIASSILEYVSRGLRDYKNEIPIRLDQVYQDYYSQLSLKVRDKPSRTLLVELDLFEEELDSILKIIQKQQHLMQDFMSFSREIELSSTRDSEHILQDALRDLDEKKAMCQELNLNVEKLRRRVIRQIDLQQDNNSKAILVFTIVTIIFLPMSFITSYFGMNTVDIRDMDLGQSIFWAVAAPFTTLVVGVCMLIAYRGERLREAVIHVLGGIPKGRGKLYGD